MVAVVGFAAIGCSVAADDATTTAPTTTVPDTTVTSSVAPTSDTTDTTPTTLPDPSTSSTSEPTTTTEATGSDAFHPTLPVRLTPPDPLPGSGGASGSGCAPGSDDLPDGVWFVLMVEDLENSVRADLACFWFGEIAYEVGEAAGEEVANDFFISNESDRIRTVPVSPEAIVWTLAGDTTEGHTEIPYEDWPNEESTYVDCPGDFCTVWLYVNDGLVTDIVEQYIP